MFVDTTMRAEFVIIGGTVGPMENTLYLHRYCSILIRLYKVYSLCIQK